MSAKTKQKNALRLARFRTQDSNRRQKAVMQVERQLRMKSEFKTVLMSHQNRFPLGSGSYDEVVTSSKLYAGTLGRTASIGEIDTKEGFEDEEGFTEWHSLEIEFLCPHGNGTDSLLYYRFGVAGQPMPQIADDSPWELEETGTEAWFDNCSCPGVT